MYQGLSLLPTSNSDSNDSEADFQDLGHNADLYILYQDDRQD